MQTIEITNEEGKAFRCLFSGWPASAAERAAWQNVVRLTVQYAFASRPATAITLSPTDSSIGSQVPSPRLVKAGRLSYLVSSLENCSAEFLADVAESEDFRRGLLWICGEHRIDDARVIAIVNQIDDADAEPHADTELLLLLDDSRSIHWLRPGRNPAWLQENLLSDLRSDSILNRFDS